MTLGAILRMWFPAALLFVGGTAALCWRGARDRQPFAERGVVAPVEVIGWKTGPCGKGSGRHAVFRFRTQDGRTVTAEHGCYGRDEPGPTVITYLPEDPERHFPADARAASLGRELRTALLFSTAGSLLLLGVALAAQAVASRVGARRGKALR